jgi:hypothetical protein
LRSRKIQKFMKCAICVRADTKKLEISWVTDITQNPYFLRPEFLPSGRATPETAAKWKIEDDLLREKGTAVGDRWRRDANSERTEAGNDLRRQD